MEHDGEYLPEIKRHSLEKIRRHNYYAAIFSKAMARKWPQRAYLGLYSGAGRARIAGTDTIVETSALSVFRQEVPFTKYIFVDSDLKCIEALRERVAALSRTFDVSYVNGDVNAAAPAILEAMPTFSKDHGLLSLCFVDPFRIDLHFDVIKRLNRFKMDFLVMLPLGLDLRRNLQRYLKNQSDTRVANLIDDPHWQEEWRSSGSSDHRFVRFILKKFDQAMVRLGFHQHDIEDTVSIKVTGMGVYLYSLALYTKHDLGRQFWRTTVTGTTEQMGLFSDGA
jgi:three-Cys-motif partner protein